MSKKQTFVFAVAESDTGPRFAVLRRLRSGREWRDDPRLAEAEARVPQSRVYAAEAFKRLTGVNAGRNCCQMLGSASTESRTVWSCLFVLPQVMLQELREHPQFLLVPVEEAARVVRHLKPAEVAMVELMKVIVKEELVPA